VSCCRGCRPRCFVVGPIPREPGDRPSRAVNSVYGPRQVAFCVRALRTAQRLEVAATRLAERGEFRTVRLIVGNIRGLVLRNSGGIRTCTEGPGTPNVLEPGENRVRATGWVRIADLGPVETDGIPAGRERPPDEHPFSRIAVLEVRVRERACEFVKPPCGIRGVVAGVAAIAVDVL